MPSGELSDVKSELLVRALNDLCRDSNFALARAPTWLGSRYQPRSQGPLCHLCSHALVVSRRPFSFVSHLAWPSIRPFLRDPSMSHYTTR